MKQIHELGELFEKVQIANLLGDGKTFADCIPQGPIEKINGDYDREKVAPGFDLKQFVLKNFYLPETPATGYMSDPNKTPGEHINELWKVLTRQPGSAGGSLIPLPHPYVVPGGRFREIYYWDSYFTMLGLLVSKRVDMIENMVNNFSFLIDTYGYIPNGNRTYFLGRSQPPFYSLMVKLLAIEKGSDVLIRYLPQLEKEYSFWMRGASEVSPSQPAKNRVVRMSDGALLNRYWDENDTPRPESFKEDVELSHQSNESPNILFRHLRAAAESGWDFSSRWFRDLKKFESIHTTDIIPTDLNCLLVHLEETIAEAHREAGEKKKADAYALKAVARKNSIQTFCWNSSTKFYHDFDFIKGTQTEAITLAAAFPLFFRISTHQQAIDVADTLRKKFLKSGGMITTTESSGQQWDAPNGWAPLQWITYKGLQNYGLNDLANELKNAWVAGNTKVYQSTGKMTEKYNVVNDSKEGGGGEYPNQDGFGWTNGVFLAMSQDHF